MIRRDPHMQRAIARARAKKELGVLPPALADEEERYVDH
jgi:hypothetical protein